jgi:hypothetical protein
MMMKYKNYSASINNLNPTYDGPPAVSAEKTVDMKDLCQKGTIPKKYHQFSENLTEKSKKLAMPTKRETEISE